MLLFNRLLTEYKSEFTGNSDIHMEFIGVEVFYYWGNSYIQHSAKWRESECVCRFAAIELEVGTEGQQRRFSRLQRCSTNFF